MKKDYKIVLASASPRRKELLEKIGLEFDICPSDKEEHVTSDIPSEVCVELSRQKAIDVASSIKSYNESHPEITTPQDIMVIGADTIVSCDGKILGKPVDEEDAKRMIKMLSDNTHEVFTGVTIVMVYKNGKAGEYSFFESTKVTCYPISDEDIDEYIASGEPMDKAGAYGIQGSFIKHVKSIEGEFSNVVGLPIARLYQELK
ncbi:MAG: Maf family protein [Lachnospiraceae bacterium]|nr:Maf family protein [Lachnospiraceae bacterium]